MMVGRCEIVASQILPEQDARENVLRGFRVTFRCKQSWYDF